MSPLEDEHLSEGTGQFGEGAVSLPASTPDQPQVPVSKRRFLKWFGAALLGVGATKAVTAPPAAQAAYSTSPPDTVTTNLTVRGNLVVTQGHRVGIGTSNPLGSLHVVGDIRNGASVVIGSDGRAVQACYASSDFTRPGTWGHVKALTWGALATSTWDQVKGI